MARLLIRGDFFFLAAAIPCSSVGVRPPGPPDVDSAEEARADPLLGPAGLNRLSSDDLAEFSSDETLSQGACCFCAIRRGCARRVVRRNRTHPAPPLWRGRTTTMTSPPLDRSARRPTCSSGDDRSETKLSCGLMPPRLPTSSSGRSSVGSSNAVWSFDLPSRR